MTRVRAWARDLWEAGQEDADTIALALIEDHEWVLAQKLLPQVAVVAGLTEEDMLARWVERDLLLTWLDGPFSAADLVDAGYRVWATLFERDAGRSFGIYNALGDLADLHLRHWDLHSLSDADLRPYVLKHLIEDGAFERAGLTRPQN